MGLTWTMIGVLAQYHYFYPVEGCQLECVENERSGRIDCLAFPFLLMQESGDPGEVFLVEFFPEHRFP